MRASGSVWRRVRKRMAQPLTCCWGAGSVADLIKRACWTEDRSVVPRLQLIVSVFVYGSLAGRASVAHLGLVRSLRLLSLLLDQPHEILREVDRALQMV